MARQIGWTVAVLYETKLIVVVVVVVAAAPTAVFH
jgi:hypothetical protein